VTRSPRGSRRGGPAAAKPTGEGTHEGTQEGMRLQRYLAMGGVAARRKAEDLITAGRVTVNGQIVRELGTRVIPDRDQVEVDGEAVVALEYFYVLFNKPKGAITAVTDDRGRQTVMDFLPNLPVPVKPVGRLDYYTEGVLLLTNDGELAARLLAPASHVPKTYHVKVRGTVAPRHVVTLRNGVRLDDGDTTLPADVELLPAESKHAWLAITIHEGKSRQIHRMFEALGYQVTKLQRVAFANLTFHGLRVGDARELSQQELNDLRDTVGLDHSVTARGKWRAKREDTDIPRRARDKAEAERAANAAAAGGAPAPVPAPAPESAPAPRTDRRDDRRPAPRGDRRPAPRDDRRPAPRDDRRPAPRDDRRPAPRDNRRDDRRGPPPRAARPARGGTKRPAPRPGKRRGR
jgi:23S rRNA pseudouridine2605 synthase